MIKKIAVSLAGLVLVVCLLAVPTYHSRWRLPPGPSPVGKPIKPPPTYSSWIKVEPIGPQWHCKRQRDCRVRNEFRVRIDVEAMRTYERPPIVSYRVTERGVADQLKLVRSSGSAKLDQDVLRKVSHDLAQYSGFPACGRWLVTMQPSVDYPDL